MSFSEALSFFEIHPLKIAERVEFQMHGGHLSDERLAELDIALYGQDFAISQEKEIVAINLRENTYQDDLLKIIRMNTGSNPFKSLRPHLYNCDSLIPVLELIYDSDQQVNNIRIDWTINIDSVNDARTFSILSGCSMKELSRYEYRNLIGLFLAVQHSQPEIIAYFYPYFVRAVENGVFKKQDLALLTDRLLLNYNYLQVYGSQIERDGTLNDVRDMENLDSLRNSVGLGTIEEYLKRFN